MCPCEIETVPSNNGHGAQRGKRLKFTSKTRTFGIPKVVKAHDLEIGGQLKGIFLALFQEGSDDLQRQKEGLRVPQND